MSLLGVNYCKLCGNTNSHFTSRCMGIFCLVFFWCGLFLVVVALEANKEIASVVAGMQQFFTEKICKAY